MTKMTDATDPRPFIGVQPCRIVDTRTGSGFPAGFGTPGLSPGVPRNFDLDNGPCAGLPAGIDAYSLNVTVVNTAGPGHLVIYPQGGAQPAVSSINYVAGQTIANAVIVPAGTGGGVTVVAGVSGTDLLIDINGYFSDTLGAPQNFFRLENNSSAQVMEVYNSSPTCFGDCGLVAIVDSNANASAVLGWYRGTGQGAGVSGTSLGNIDSAGVRGAGTAGPGVNGSSAADHGGLFQTFSAGDFDAGVFGRASSPTGKNFGGRFITDSATPGTAGVRGEEFGSGGSPFQHDTNPPAGILGLSDDNFGVLGICDEETLFGDGCNAATAGHRYSSVGTLAHAGYLGFNGAGVRFINGLSGTGTKSFIEPHPTDASKTISYVSLEGNEAGTYFRGRGRFNHGVATIDIPEDFRMVTHEDGLSIQVTPIGEMATVAVAYIGLDRIVVRGSRNVEFFYTVNGVRRAYPTWNPIGPNENDFVPESADAKVPDFLSEDERSRLIRNGTYNADGSVNMDTARRLGWEVEWNKRGLPSTQP